MEQEKWKDIIHYNGVYLISNIGNVKNTITNKVLRIKYKKKGYAFVGLSRDGNVKYHHVHRLVAIAFISNPNNKPCVNHKNGIKHNNGVDNLEWVTHKENMYHAIKTGLIDFKSRKYNEGKEHPRNKTIFKRSLKGRVLKKYYCMIELLNDHPDFNSSKIHRVCKLMRGNKTAYGYKWTYL